MGRIHKLKIKPESKEESHFMKLLDKVDVKESLVMCKRGYIFGTPYDEYMISDGLYKLIGDKLEKMKRA